MGPLWKRIPQLTIKHLMELNENMNHLVLQGWFAFLSTSIFVFFLYNLGFEMIGLGLLSGCAHGGWPWRWGGGPSWPVPSSQSNIVLGGPHVWVPWSLPPHLVATLPTWHRPKGKQQWEPILNSLVAREDNNLLKQLAEAAMPKLCSHTWMTLRIACARRLQGGDPQRHVGSTRSRAWKRRLHGRPPLVQYRLGLRRETALVRP